MTIIQPKQIVLKDGPTVTLRSGNVDDAEGLQEHIDRILEDGTGMVAVPGEISLTLEKRRDWIKLTEENPNEIFLLVMHEGKIIANLDFHLGKRKRLAHTGSFGISVQTKWRGNGIGGILIDKLVDWATENPNIEKICLDVISTNESAIGLYEKKGFVEEGREVRSIKFENGSYADNLKMAKFL